VNINYGILHSLPGKEVESLKKDCMDALGVSAIASRMFSKKRLMELGIIQGDCRGSIIAIQKVLIELRNISPDPELKRKDYKKPVPKYMHIEVEVLDVVPFRERSPLNKYQEFFNRLGKMSFQVEKDNPLYEKIIEDIQFNPNLDLIFEKPIW